MFNFSKCAVYVFSFSILSAFVPVFVSVLLYVFVSVFASTFVSVFFVFIFVFVSVHLYVYVSHPFAGQKLLQMSFLLFSSDPHMQRGAINREAFFKKV